MDKVYLVTIDQGAYDDYHWWIDSIWKSAQKAENRKQEILKKIELNKLDYSNKYGYELEADRDYISYAGFGEIEFNDEEYDKITERVYLFEHENPEMEYNNINVKEMQVL